MLLYSGYKALKKSMAKNKGVDSVSQLSSSHTLSCVSLFVSHRQRSPRPRS